jgi:hypothetical protein
MSADYKYEMQLIADELAKERFGTDFYSLSQAKQDSVFNDAMQAWQDKQASRADLLEDR